MIVFVRFGHTLTYAMLSFVFLFQPLPAASSTALLSLFTDSSATPSSDYQPISLLLHSLHSLLLFARDNTVVVFLTFLLTSTVLWLLGFNLLIPPSSLTSFFRFTLGVSTVRTKRAVTELKRKSFHLLGLLIPFIYYLGSKYTQWLDQPRAVLILSGFTGVVWLVEAMRLWWPAFRRGYSRMFAPLLRKKELSDDKLKLTGVAYFFLGNLLCVFLFEPTIAVCASRQQRTTISRPCGMPVNQCRSSSFCVVSCSMRLQCTWCWAT